MPIHVFTFKAGLLSPVAHDLRLSLRRYAISIDGDEVRGRFWPSSLVVDGAVEDGRVQEGKLSAKDKRDIQENVEREVLRAGKHPEVTFEGKIEGGTLAGTLSLNGQRQPVRIPAKREGDRLSGEATLAPSQWGIPPFKALMGAIKLQDKVVVRFDVTSGQAPGEGDG